MKTVCKTSQGSTTTWWRWRIIDGKKCWFPGKAVIDKSQLTWDPPEVVVEPKPSRPELALPKSTDLPGSTVLPGSAVLPALSLPAKNQDRLQVEDNLGSPKPIRQVIPGLQQYEVKTVTAVPDKPSLSFWLEIVPLVAAALTLLVWGTWSRGAGGKKSQYSKAGWPTLDSPPAANRN
jgi:hypothetical protein